VLLCHQMSNIFRLKCTKFTFHWGSAPDPNGEFTASLDSLAVFKGPKFKGSERKGRGGKGEMKER